MNEKPLEGNLEAPGGTDAKPNPSAADSQPLSGDFAQLIAGLQKKIDAQDGEIRALKSGKDKAVDRVVKSNEETLAKFAKYLNVDEEQLKKAQRESLLDDLIAERNGGHQPAAPISGKVETQGNSTELGFIDTALELPANDSRVTDLKLKYAGNPSEYLKQALSLKASFQTNPPSPAEQLPPDGKPPVKPVIDVSAKIAELNILQKTPTQNRDRIKQLKAELDSVNWGG